MVTDYRFPMTATAPTLRARPFPFPKLVTLARPSARSCSTPSSTSHPPPPLKHYLDPHSITSIITFTLPSSPLLPLKWPTRCKCVYVYANKCIGRRYSSRRSISPSLSDSQGPTSISPNPHCPRIRKTHDPLLICILEKLSLVSEWLSQQFRAGMRPQLTANKTSTVFSLSTAHGGLYL